MKQITNRRLLKTSSSATKKAQKNDNRLPKTSSSIANKKRGFEKKRKIEKTKPHQQYGTSKLEEEFAHNFLDKLGVEYEYQYEAKDIGRFYDFYLPKSRVLIEVDGDFWHANPDLYEEKDLKFHQRKAKKVDEYKNKWAAERGIPLLRIWEHDIRKTPKKVLDFLKKELYIVDAKKNLLENKRKRH